MSIREDLVASAVRFLQDPNVATSPVENRLSFLRAKNLTQEEIDTALARAGSSPQPAGAPVQQAQPYYGQYSQQPYGWQPPPPEVPKRDWRDWFIMATVMGGVGYGLYFISKRYLYPLVAPPAPEKLEEDKTTVQTEFEKVFASIDQLSKDTEALKASEEQRNEKLDKILEEMETVMKDLKSAQRRQEDEMERVRDETRAQKGAIAKSMNAQEELTETRLKELSNEVKGMKTLIGQRMGSGSSPAPPNGSSNHLRPNGSNAASTNANSSPATPAAEAASSEENNDSKEKAAEGNSAQNSRQDYISSLGARSSPFGSGMPTGKASIPAWQMAANKKPTVTDGQQEGSSSS